MGSLITYSAIAAKLAAMRGHFLTDDEFSVLAGMENVPAAVEYLKSSPAYRDVFSGVENEELHRSKIEELLWHSLYGDFSRLFRFANGTQRKFLDLYFLHFEIDDIVYHSLSQSYVFTEQIEIEISLFRKRIDHIGVQVYR